MTKCEECGAVNGGVALRTEGIVEIYVYEVCAKCGSEDSVKEIDEAQHYEEKELDARLSEWKDRKHE